MIIEGTKVGLLIPSYSGGGAERVIISLANHLVENGWEVELVVYKNKGPYKEILNKNVLVHVLVKRETNPVLDKLIMFFMLCRYFSSTSCTYCMSTIREFNIICALAKFFTFSKVKLYLREATSLDSVKSKPYSVRIIYGILTKWAYNYADRVIAISNTTKLELVDRLGMPKEKIEVLYNPVVQYECLASKYKRTGIVCVSRLTKLKQVDQIIRALAIVVKAKREVVLSVIGEGPEKDALERLVIKLNISAHVNFLGFVSDPERYIASSRILVHASIYEGFGNVFAEALSCGTPIVAYKGSGAISEVLEHGEVGTLVPLDDTMKLADEIIRCYDAPVNRKGLITSAARFSSEKILGKYESLFCKQ